MRILIDLQGAQSQSHQRGIGRYTRELTKAFLQRAGGHDIHLALTAPLDGPTDKLIAELSDYIQRDRIHYLRLPYGLAVAERSGAWLHRAAARLMRHMLGALNPDVVWHSSLFEGGVEDALVPDAVSRDYGTAATLYDLIPLHDEGAHLGNQALRNWYHARLRYLRSCDLLLSISQWSTEDASRRLGLPLDRIATIGAAVDPTFRPRMLSGIPRQRLLSRYGISRPFVLYNGGLDPRKNVGALVQAYARLPADLRARHQLVVVGKGAPEQARLRELGRRSGLLPDDVVFTGFVPDEDLVFLYSDCSLFAFPSVMEGFGLPPLEAMACGAPVVCSSATSLPEVLGRTDVLFAPDRPEELSSLMATVLTSKDLSRELREYGLKRAAGFTWNAVADRALQGLDALHARRQRAQHPRTPGTGQQVRSPAGPATLSAAHAPQKRDETVANAPDCEPSLRIIDSTSADDLGQASTRPGVVLLAGRAPSRIPLGNLERRHVYEAGGFGPLARIANESHVDALASVLPLLHQAAGVVVSDRALLDRLRALGFNRPAIVQSEVDAGAREDQITNWSRARTKEARLISELGALPGNPSEDDLAQIAFAISSMQDRSRKWLVDVSNIARDDIGTGIQQVVRGVLGHWLRQPPRGFRVEPVRFEDGHYRYARRYACDLLGLGDIGLQDGIADAAPGDMFIGLDWAAEAIPAARNRIEDWRRGGIDTCFVVYDLLPLSMPEHFHRFSCGQFETWLRSAVHLADRIACISETTAAELSGWLDSARPTYQFGKRPVIGTFALGADAPDDVAGPSVLRPSLMAAVTARPSLLMVGTLEPRKRHAEGLEIAEQLWRAGTDVNLIVAGHRGWLTEALTARLDRHPERDRRLFWHEDVSRAELHELYGRSAALLALSTGEGYGLPLVEAAQHGLPIFASDLPVFREVMGDYPHYLEGPPQTWWRAVDAWLRQGHRRRQPRIAHGWARSAQMLAELALSPATVARSATVPPAR